LLVQFPVLISLFYMLRTDLKQKICGPAMNAYLRAHHHATLSTTSCSAALPHGSHAASFLFISDITVKATGVSLIVLILLYLATMLATSYFSTAQLQGSQRYMMLLLPVVFTVVIYRYPAGLLMYWVTTNLTQLPLQWFVRRRVGTPPPVAAATASAAGNGIAKKSAARDAVRAASPVRADPPRQPPRKRKKRSGRRR
jgi:YidC/Oxa1 family membrane protein insertase